MGTSLVKGRASVGAATSMRRSAATRIAATTAGVLLLSLVVLGGSAVAISYALMARGLDRRIAEASAELLRRGGSDRAAIVAAIRQHAIGSTTGVSFALFAPDGARLAGPSYAPVARLGWYDMELHDPVEGTDPIRILTVRTPGGDLLSIAGNRRPLMMAQAAIGWLFLASVVTIALLCAIMGWLLARYLDRRLAPIAATARAVQAGDLAQRVPVSRREDEIDMAAASLNVMLDRIAALMENLRQVSSDLAHDLRTPLTRLRTRLEGASSAADARAAIPAAIAEIDAVVRLFEAILRIAEIDGRRQSDTALVELEALALDVVGAMGEAFHAAGIDLRLRSDHDCSVTGDRAQIAAALVNLLENVLQHAGRGARARVTVRCQDDSVLMSVADDGPGVPAADLDRIFDRFVRLDRARSTPGHGLGLSLVRAIATAHGASVSAQPGEGGRGLAVTIAFPLAHG